MSDWQPIETAPKDGTEVLAFFRGQFGTPWFGVAFCADAAKPLWVWPYTPQPTYWQPLPPPPSHMEKT